MAKNSQESPRLKWHQSLFHFFSESPGLIAVIIVGIICGIIWPFYPVATYFIFGAFSIYTLYKLGISVVEAFINKQLGSDLLAIIAIIATTAVWQWWAAWIIDVMVFTGEAIETFAESKAKKNLTLLLNAAPQVAHLLNSSRIIPTDSQSSKIAGTTLLNSHLNGDISSSFKTDPLNMSYGVGEVNGLNSSTRSANQKNISTESSIENVTTVPIEQIQPGDEIVIKPGEVVPTDGILLSEHATVDLSQINGEPVPEDISQGSPVVSGSINGGKAIIVRSTATAEHSQYQKIIDLVRTAEQSRPQVVRTADALSIPFTVISLLIAGLAWGLTGDPTRFAQVLVLATPCPLLISAPVAYLGGTGRLARAGIIIKTQEILENLGNVTHAFFDKTGTLTYSQPNLERIDLAQSPLREKLTEEGVVLASSMDAQTYSTQVPLAKSTGEIIGDDIKNKSFHNGHRWRPREILYLAGPLESYSVHILAHGIKNAYDEQAQKEGWRMPAVHYIQEDSGNGISGVVEGHRIRIGRLAYALGRQPNETLITTTLTAPMSVPSGLSTAPTTSGTIPAADMINSTNFPTSATPPLSSESLKIINPELNPALSAAPNSSLSLSGAQPLISHSSSSIEIPTVKAVPGSFAAQAQENANGQTSPSSIQLPSVEAQKQSHIKEEEIFRNALDDFTVPLQENEIATYVSIDGYLVARFVLKDFPRKDARQTVTNLRLLGIDEITMITGDNRTIADSIGKQVGISDIHANLLPDQKLSIVAAARKETVNNTPVLEKILNFIGGQRHQHPISMMVGDGVNDAPVLATADIGIAVTDGSSTAASESAQVVIMNNQLSMVPKAIVISRQTKNIMLQAVGIGLLVATILMILAACNFIPVIIGALLQECIDVVSILWALTTVLDHKINIKGKKKIKEKKKKK